MAAKSVTPKRIVVYVGAVGIPLLVTQALFGTSTQQILAGLEAALIFMLSTIMVWTDLQRRRSLVLFVGGTMSVLAVLILYLRFMGGYGRNAMLAPLVAGAVLLLMSWMILRRDDAV